jgi:predicted RNA binding protein YcfA (HicA-like mRNA interferase family)
MMAKLARLTGQQVLAALKKAGFEVLRIKGSHHFMRHPDGRSTVVPIHRGEIIGPGLMLKILRDCELEREEFMSFVK